MPELRITIGGREFEVACQEGEQKFLHAAASLLNQEAATMSDQLGRMPESRMLLMAGLMLADKTLGLDETARRLQAELADLKNRPAPAPERIEVPVVPTALSEGLAELAARAEAMADEMEEAGR